MCVQRWLLRGWNKLHRWSVTSLASRYVKFDLAMNHFSPEWLKVKSPPFQEKQYLAWGIVYDKIEPKISFVLLFTDDDEGILGIHNCDMNAAALLYSLCLLPAPEKSMAVKTDTRVVLCFSMGTMKHALTSLCSHYQSGPQPHKFCRAITPLKVDSSSRANGYKDH